MADSSRYAFPFQTKIEMESERPEEVPLQEIVFKNIQNFTREDFDQAKMDLENTRGKDGEMKGFKYTYYSPYPEQKNKSEETQQNIPNVQHTLQQQQCQKEEEKIALRSPTFLSVSLDFQDEPTYSPYTEERSTMTACPLEQIAEPVRRLPKQLKPIVRHKKLPAREEDVEDVNTSYLISRYR